MSIIGLFVSKLPLYAANGTVNNECVRVRNSSSETESQGPNNNPRVLGMRTDPLANSDPQKAEDRRTVGKVSIRSIWSLIIQTKLQEGASTAIIHIRKQPMNNDDPLWELTVT